MLNQEQARNFIAELKKDYGFTYGYIAELLGVSANHIYHFMLGDRNLKRDKIFKLERLMNTRLGVVNMNV